MHPYPHFYTAIAIGTAKGPVKATSPGLPAITTAPPPQFDGPEGLWSPETLLCAAIADCFILTFRAVSRAAQLEWLALECRVEGTLERAEAISQFTKYKIIADLVLAEGSELSKAKALLDKPEQSCLISNSLRGTRYFEPNVLMTARPCPRDHGSGDADPARLGPREDQCARLSDPR